MNGALAVADMFVPIPGKGADGKQKGPGIRRKEATAFHSSPSPTRVLFGKRSIPAYPTSLALLLISISGAWVLL